jgi:hypothetical protein
MRIDNTGKIGVGTSTPNSTFHVKDSSDLQGIFETTGTLGRINLITPETTSNNYDVRFDTGTALSSANVYGMIRGTITQANPSLLKGQLSFWTNQGDSLQQRLTILDSGGVGIGTTAPQAPLHILGAAVVNYGTLVIQSTSNGDAATGWVSFYDSGGTRRGFVGDGSGTNDDIYLRADTGDLHLGDSSSSIVMNLQNGTVGIGILSPDNTLHIWKGSAGTVTGTPNAPLVIENSTSCYIHVLSPAANEQGILFGDPTDSISGGIILGSSNQMQLRSGGNTTQVTILSDGSVGVGTTSPLAKLDVRNILRVGESINAIYDGSVPAHGGILIKSSSGQSRTSWIYQDNATFAAGAGGLFIQSTHGDMVLNAGTVTAADILLNPNVAGKVGVGINDPQGKLHGYDVISGFIHWEYDGLAGTTRTIIPNGTGDMLYGNFFMYVVRDSSGITVQGSAGINNGASTTIATDVNNKIDFAIAADGSFTVVRSLGTRTYKVAVWVIWL